VILLELLKVVVVFKHKTIPFYLMQHGYYCPL